MPPLKSKTMQCSSVLLAPFRVNSHFTFLRMDHLFVSSTAKAFHILLQDFKFRSVIFSALQRKKSTSSFRTSRRSTFTSSRYRLPPPPFTTEGMTTRVSQKNFSIYFASALLPLVPNGQKSVSKCRLWVYNTQFFCCLWKLFDTSGQTAEEQNLKKKNWDTLMPTYHMTGKKQC